MTVERVLLRGRRRSRRNNSRELKGYRMLMGFPGAIEYYLVIGHYERAAVDRRVVRAPPGEGIAIQGRRGRNGNLLTKRIHRIVRFGRGISQRRHILIIIDIGHKILIRRELCRILGIRVIPPVVRVMFQRVLRRLGGQHRVVADMRFSQIPAVKMISGFDDGFRSRNVIRTIGGADVGLLSDVAVRSGRIADSIFGRNPMRVQRQHRARRTRQVILRFINDELTGNEFHIVIRMFARRFAPFHKRVILTRKGVRRQLLNRDASALRSRDVAVGKHEDALVVHLPFGFVAVFIVFHGIVIASGCHSHAAVRRRGDPGDVMLINGDRRKGRRARVPSGVRVIAEPAFYREAGVLIGFVHQIGRDAKQIGAARAEIDIRAFCPGRIVPNGGQLVWVFSRQFENGLALAIYSAAFAGRIVVKNLAAINQGLGFSFRGDRRAVFRRAARNSAAVHCQRSLMIQYNRADLALSSGDFDAVIQLQFAAVHRKKRGLGRLITVCRRVFDFYLLIVVGFHIQLRVVSDGKSAFGSVGFDRSGSADRDFARHVPYLIFGRNVLSDQHDLRGRRRVGRLQSVAQQRVIRIADLAYALLRGNAQSLRRICRRRFFLRDDAGRKAVRVEADRAFRRIQRDVFGFDRVGRDLGGDLLQRVVIQMAAAVGHIGLDVQHFQLISVFRFHAGDRNGHAFVKFLGLIFAAVDIDANVQRQQHFGIRFAGGVHDFLRRFHGDHGRPYAGFGGQHAGNFDPVSIQRRADRALAQRVLQDAPGVHSVALFHQRAHGSIPQDAVVPQRVLFPGNRAFRVALDHGNAVRLRVDHDGRAAVGKEHHVALRGQILRAADVGRGKRRRVGKTGAAQAICQERTVPFAVGIARLRSVPVPAAALAFFINDKVIRRFGVSDLGYRGGGDALGVYAVIRPLRQAQRFVGGVAGNRDRGFQHGRLALRVGYCHRQRIFSGGLRGKGDLLG